MKQIILLLLTLLLIITCDKREFKNPVASDQTLATPANIRVSQKWRMDKIGLGYPKGCNWRLDY